MLTNEESRVGTYPQIGTPTSPGAVTANTPLTELDLNWTEKQLPQNQRTKHVHGLHPYLGKYIPQLVEVFLRKFFSPGQRVLDPFVGSGTTLVQANELSIRSVGYDVSAFNVLLSQVKTDNYDVVEAEREAKDVLQRTRGLVNRVNGQLSFWEQATEGLEILPVDSQYLQDWFAPQALRELLTYRTLLESGSYKYKNLLRIILARSARSARLTTHFDLDFPKRPQREPYSCYKHSRICYPTEEAYKFLARYTKDTVQRLQDWQRVRTEAEALVYHNDSRQVDAPFCDGIITSPPYVGLIDYHVQHEYAYHLLGLHDNRHREIGPASSGTSQAAIATYQADIAKVFSNVTKQMPPGAPIVVVAGDRHNLYPRIAEIAELEQESVVQRHVNRRTGRRAGEFYESVFIWRKP
jgi:DNA modification methylase